MTDIKTVLTERALSAYKPPFKFQRGYFFDADGNMVADKHEEMRVRGWGRISYMPTPEELQDHIGKLIAQAMTEFWNAHAAPVDAQDAVDAKRLDWLMHNLGGYALRTIGVITSGNCDRDSIDKAMQASQSPQDQVKP